MASSGLVVVDAGLERAGALLANSWPGTRRIGLYEVAVAVDRHTTFANLTPCAWSGYAGELPLPALDGMAFDGPLFVLRFQAASWVCDGGSPGGYVAGYYVVDADGALLWVEPRAAGPQTVTLAGQTYVVVPRVSVATRFGGET